MGDETTAEAKVSLAEQLIKKLGLSSLFKASLRDSNYSGTTVDVALIGTDLVPVAFAPAFKMLKSDSPK
jgi:hypothetical protein